MNRQPLPSAPRRTNDEVEDYTIEERKTLDSIEKKHTINFPLKATYTSLTGPESFRELVQNWYETFLPHLFIRSMESYVNHPLLIQQERRNYCLVQDRDRY
jgi:hypothetical protein